MSKEFKSFLNSKTMDIDDRTVIGIAAVMGVVDSYNDIIKMGAFRESLKTDFNDIKFLWQHDASTPPVAAIKSIKEVRRANLPKELLSEYPEATGGVEIAREYLDTERGNEVLAGIKSDPPAIKRMSFAFMPREYDIKKGESGDNVRVLKKVKVYDFSDVNWGANPATLAQKSVLPFIESPPDPVSQSWDAESEVKKATVDDLKEMCVWYDEENPDTKGSYKLPHHRANSEHNVNWNGVKAAMGALLGARGGVKIPSSERKTSYNHLAKHYKQFDKEPPDFKAFELYWSAKELIEAGYDGKVFSPLIDYIEKSISVNDDIIVDAGVVAVLNSRLAIAARSVV